MSPRKLDHDAKSGTLVNSQFNQYFPDTFGLITNITKNYEYLKYTKKSAGLIESCPLGTSN